VNEKWNIYTDILIGSFKNLLHFESVTLSALQIYLSGFCCLLCFTFYISGFLRVNIIYIKKKIE